MPWYSAPLHCRFYYTMFTIFFISVVRLPGTIIKSDDELIRIITEARSEMRETAESEGNTPLVCGDYELYHFFSGGVYFLCIRGSETGT